MELNDVNFLVMPTIAMPMKILHVSHGGLPDVRVEKEALTLRDFGYDISFVGSKFNGLFYERNPFSRIINIPFSLMAKAGIHPWWGALRRKLLSVVTEMKPDLIHAHDIIAGSLVASISAELNIPFIYDDHEYWSKETAYGYPVVSICKVSVGNFEVKCSVKNKILLVPRNLKYIARMAVCTKVYKEWESKVVAMASAVITVSEEIAKEHRKLNSEVIVIPNYPFLKEMVENGGKARKAPLKIVYIGKILGMHPPYRDLRGFINIMKDLERCEVVIVGDNDIKTAYPLISLGVIPHRELIKRISVYHVGLLPWAPHPFHRYCNPNKAYEYAAAGLHVIVPSSLTPVKTSLGNLCETFENYDGLRELLIYYSDYPEEAVEKGKKILALARKMLTWDNVKWQLLSIYEKMLT